MGIDSINSKSKKEMIDYIKSENIMKKRIENRFLKRNVKKSDLTNEELEILKCLSKPVQVYYCAYCPSFPLILFRTSIDKSTLKKSLELVLLEHNWEIKRDSKKYSHVYKEDKLTFSLNTTYRDIIEKDKIHLLVKDKYIKNTSDDLLPFESLDDFHEYLKVVIKYKALKEQIAYYNLGNTKKNSAFTFFEFLLNIGLYGFGTLYEYLNALSIFDFLSLEALGHLNCGEHMKNGDLIYEFSKLDLKQVINLKKLNDNNLLAYIIDTNYRFSQYKDANCGILLKKFDIEDNYFYAYLGYLKYKENDPPSKNRIIKYGDYDYKDIIELEQDKYLLLVKYDNNNPQPNLIIANIIENTEKYDYKLIEDIICLSFLKLKSNQIFLICNSSIQLMEYNGYELKAIKILNYSLEITKSDYLCYELLNGDILFDIKPNKFCYFNMKSFSIPTIIEKGVYDNYTRFNQLNDKNYFYFFPSNIGYEFSIKNGKIKRILIDNNSKENAKKLGEYYINYYNSYMNIITENNKKIYTIDFRDEINDILIIDNKEKIFATLAFCENNYSMYIYFYKLRKHNN